MSTLFFASRRASVRLMTISAAAAQRSLGGTVHTIAACGPVDKKIVIIGGGTGGVGVAAQLLNAGLKNVTIIEPKREIYYQPLWTLVAAGLKKNTDSVKPLTAVVPRGSVLVQKAVTEIDPAKNTVVMRDGSCIKYDFLVVAAGIQIDWGKIPGLVSALEDTVGKRSVVSIYDYDYSAAAWEVFKAALRREGCSSRMLFTMPNTPIKCAGAPQKIMWLVEEMLDQKMRKEVRVQYLCSDSWFVIPNSCLFPCDV
jgi:NADPH-dependent 2,4-dienoyl-CoA reductase/sulfur reductase-like enzyme